MKNRIFLVTVLAALLLALAACSGDNNDATEDKNTDEAATTETAYEPEDVKDTDVCEVCAMAVPNNEHATQIVLTNERSLKFDDIGCMYEWIEENGEEDIGTAFVRDFNSEEWFDFNEATFVFDESIETPMAYGIISFIEESEAEQFIDEFGTGELLDRADLTNHEWKMYKDMDGHDHDEHDHEEHDDMNEDEA